MLIRRYTVIWLKYCRHGVKTYAINHDFKLCNRKDKDLPFNRKSKSFGVGIAVDLEFGHVSVIVRCHRDEGRGPNRELHHREFVISLVFDDGDSHQILLKGV